MVRKARKRVLSKTRGGDFHAKMLKKAPKGKN